MTSATNAAPIALEYDEVNIVVSDFHLSAGAKTPTELKYSWFGRLLFWLLGNFGWQDIKRPSLAGNPLEDFPDDTVFTDFLATMTARYAGSSRIIRLRLMGDMFDPLAVLWRGRFKDPPFEDTAVVKMTAIVAGHPRFFRALADFLRQPFARVDIFVGNHDICLVWAGVQRLLSQALVGDCPEAAERLRFIDQRQEFRDIDRGVLYEHGMNGEFHTSFDAPTVILTRRIGSDQELPRPVLNQPLGNYMTCSLVYPMKLDNPLVCRLKSERDIWAHAYKHRWLWGLRFGVMLAWNFIYNTCFAFWDIRRKTNFLHMMRAMLGTLRVNPVDKYAEALQKRFPEVKLVILGHSHVERVVCGPKGTYLNTGSWAKQLRFEWPCFERTWKRWRWLEPLWRSTVHFFRTGELRLAARIVRTVIFITVLAGLGWFLWTSFPANERLWGSLLNDLKVYAGLLMLIIGVLGIFRFLVVEPDLLPAERYTFVLVCHRTDGNLEYDLMEWFPREGEIKKYV
ncbi:hypothetical protein A3C96_02460 [Candidatus Uhrbacteria bacterium RIFCSPHIGHO2_02_FULL_60_10]|uniref:Calcineurin-like phosphoesterase domain-containing protein n=1 Tax=Candidatus Uhrbacteria bacterium RIFCSPHIGHO2_02_FULL_60_10 TaxID=1802392 RepID=A0A1F7U9I4_9BACT|nr:MAG: hypothetical protein A3C96_02460 [Candidatus Uhrbacteria bacterium RIFCSPHIGHO2_02_FULL_60_10]